MMFILCDLIFVETKHVFPPTPQVKISIVMFNDDVIYVKVHFFQTSQDINIYF